MIGPANIRDIEYADQADMQERGRRLRDWKRRVDAGYGKERKVHD